MSTSLAIKDVHVELEQLRNHLHQSIQGELTRLTDPCVLPISQQLDLLILEAQRALTTEIK